eukprot:gene8799-9740_t
MSESVNEICEKQLTVWQREQLELKKKLVVIDDANARGTADVDMSELKFIAGADISFPECKDDWVHACSAFVVISFPQLEVVYKECSLVHLSAPYIPEYLAFREAFFFQDAFNKLKESNPEFLPQVLLIDGNGILHPRGFGIASHVGVLLDLPTIGVAKHLFHVDGLEKNEEHKKKISDDLKKAGDRFELIGQSGKVHGQALRSTDKSSNPVFVSVGHKISLETSTNIVNQCCKFRTPEAVRQADILSREYIRKNYQEHIRECNTDWQKKSDLFRGIEKHASLLKRESIKTTEKPS